MQHKKDAQLALREATELEAHSRARSLSRADIIFFLNRGYISDEEAARLSSMPVPASLTWRELRKTYEDYSRANCRAYTHACNLSRLDTVLEFFEPLKHPADINEDDVRRYISHRRGAGKKAATIYKELAVLRRLLDPLGADNPARKVTPPRIDDERLPRVLSPDEVQRFLAAVEQYKHLLYGRLKPLVLIYLYAGLRPSEIVNLTPRDVDLNAGKLYIQAKQGYRTKTGNARGVDIHPDLRPHLEGLTGPWLFAGEKQIDPKSVSRAIRKVLDAAGIMDATPYSLRHSFNSYLLDAGATLREVMEQAGHRRISTTQRYLHVIPRRESPVHRIDFTGRKEAKNRPKK